ncbi:hypothetical protein ACFWF9_12515 [Streptomyces roseolus]|uniref:hypothetical protein n=1 Tax=Streptomyces roseolus TaxID=67358 RepID=UPI00365286BF
MRVPQGRISFTSLLRSHADRVRGGVPVSYIAFDLLAVPGRDVRAPPLQRVPVTEDEETARGWFRGLLRAGGEGIVAERLDSAYRSGPTWCWRKGRHAEPVGLAGPALRPRALLVRLPDGRILPTTPRLTPAHPGAGPGGHRRDRPRGRRLGRGHGPRARAGAADRPAGGGGAAAGGGGAAAGLGAARGARVRTVRGEEV